jgi:hypothetical protein
VVAAVNAAERHHIRQARDAVARNPDRLDVHHRTYERVGQEQLRDLIVLCRTCHSRYHDKAA